MFGAVPVSASRAAADFGLFFMNADGYDVDMCIHGTIGVVTALCETGTLPPKPTYTIETPAGLVEARASIDGERVTDVTVRNVDSFVHERVTIPLDGHGDVDADVVYVGNFYALVDVEQFDETVEPAQVPTLVNRGLAAMDALNEAHTVRNPLTGDSKAVTAVQFYGSRDGVDNNLMVGPGGKIDRSPCGTGTCARMALRHARGDLDVDEPYTHEGVLGTRFEGRIVDARETAEATVVTPAVTGSASLVGTHTFLLDPDDPLLGFRNLTSPHAAAEIVDR
jgi:proline racemase